MARRTLSQEAKRLNITEDALRKRCRQGDYPHAVKSGRTWYFDDSKKGQELYSTSIIDDLKEAPDKEDSDRLKAYYEARERKAKAITAESNVAQLEGQLVNRSILEDEWKECLIRIKKNVLNIPDLARQRFGEGMSKKNFDDLTDIVRDSLNRAIEDVG